MAETNIIRDAVNRVMSGIWTFTGTVNLPADTVDENDLKTTALLPAAKLVTRFPVVCGRQAPGTDVVAKTEHAFTAKFAGIITHVEANTTTAPTGGDKKFTVDVKKSTGGGAFATILSATFDVDNGEADMVATAGTLDAAKDDYVAGDLFETIVTVSGSTGSQGQGMSITLWAQENPTS